MGLIMNLHDLGQILLRIRPQIVHGFDEFVALVGEFGDRFEAFLVFGDLYHLVLHRFDRFRIIEQGEGSIDVFDTPFDFLSHLFRRFV